RLVCISVSWPMISPGTDRRGASFFRNLASTYEHSNEPHSSNLVVLSEHLVRRRDAHLLCAAHMHLAPVAPDRHGLCPTLVHPGQFRFKTDAGDHGQSAS